MTNPILATWDTPFGLPPFDKISDDQFAEAIDVALARDRAEVDAVADDPEPATFANTIEGLISTGEALDRVMAVFWTLAGTDANATREALMREFSPRLAAHSAETYANRRLFDRIKAVWEARDTLDLSAEQVRVLYLVHRGFVRAGAALEGADADRMKEIKARLATLGTSFTQNLLADERGWQMELGEADLEGLPDFLARAARAAGEERGAGGPVVTLSRSLVVPFLQFSSHRALRERAWRAWTARGANGGETDNRAIATEILGLRAERAALLGYPDFAHYKLETEMAGTPEAVRNLLMQVWKPARAQAEADAAALEDMLHADGISGPLEPWDWHYYTERRRAVLHDLDEEALKPYFPLKGMIEAAFDCANRLFGLEFAPLDVPLHHPDAMAWEVTRNGQHVAVFVGDYFARGSKRSGAWCSALRMQRKFPEMAAPVVLNVCNFAKDDPALLSWDDARTLFHEFGHALHQMLSDVTYDMVAGTSVARDFVELPSQLYEHWLEVPEVLDGFARHAGTGEALPADLRDRLLGAATYDMGFQTVEYVASALVDLAFHEGEPPTDPMQRQAEVLDEIGMPRAISMRHATPHFAHVFAGDGYSSGYYSYMWSEVMDADAFSAFEEAGNAFDAGVAARLKTHILSAGGTEDAGELYMRFRGRMPGVDALLRGRGLAA